MAARDDPEADIDLDVKAWEKQTRASCGVDEPPRLFAIFQLYCATNPRSLRVAVARSRGLEGPEAAAVRASGSLLRSVRFWRWPERAREWDKHTIRVEKAALDARRAAARRRRLDHLDRLSESLGLRLEEIAEKATLEGLLKLYAAEREELGEDRSARIEENEPDLPSIESRVPPPPENNEPE